MQEQRRVGDSPSTMKDGLLPVAALAATVSLLIGGCSSSRDLARNMAISMALENANKLQSVLQASTEDTLPEEQLIAAKSAVSGSELVASSDDTGVKVAGTLTARGESGGGFSYERYIVRLCLRYRIAPMTGKTTVKDVKCNTVPASALRADETIRLND